MISQKFIRTGITVFLLIVTVFPVFFLFGKSLFMLLADENFLVPSISMGLFLKSLRINLTSTLICSGMGFIAALFIWTYFEKTRKRAFYILAFSALIPPFIHVHSWIKFIDSINEIIFSISGILPDFTGEGAVVAVTAFSYLPFTAALCLFGLLSIPSDVFDSIRTEKFSITVYYKIIFPFILSYILVGMLFVFLLNINEYAIPSVFGVNVYALELFAIFSATGNLHTTALASWPLIILSLTLLFLLYLIINKTGISENFTDNRNYFKNENSMKFLNVTGGIIILLFAVVPLVSMVVESFTVNNLLGIIKSSSEQFVYSYFSGAITAVLIVFLASFYSYLKFYSVKVRSYVFLFTIPFILPSSILGLSLIAFYNPGILNRIYTSPGMPIFGLFTRFFVLAVLYFSFKFKRMDKNLADELKLNYSMLRGYFKVILPLLKADLVTVFLLTFALSISEYGIVHLITPPGYQMLTIKIYNYLHYGSSEVVFALNLTVFVTILISGFVIACLYGIKGEKK